MERQIREAIRNKKRIVVKIGSSSLQHPETGDLDYIKMEVLVRELCNLRNQGKDFLWQEYLDELEQKGPMWVQVYTAFRDALAQLDFKPMWNSEKLEELIEQTEGPEV